MKNIIRVLILPVLVIALMMSGCRQVNEKAGGSPSGEGGNGVSDGTVSGGTVDKNGSTGADTANDQYILDESSGSKAGGLQYNNRDELLMDKLSNMTLEEKIGQMFMIGIEGTAMNDELESHLAKILPGGIILFDRNADNPEQLLELINSLKKVNSDRIPLFISVDEEGGRVSRMPPQLHEMPSAEAIGQTDDPSAAYQFGKVQAEKIKAFGFNMNMAPVLDIRSNPQNTVIGDRAFGNTPEKVSKYGMRMMNGIRDSGVIAVVKHFPGHGDTQVDSHYDLPVVDHDFDRLESFELAPFKKAIEDNADAVMVAHILMSRIDAGYPASLSETVINGLLREKMGFEGVVITDDMTMAAITKHYRIEEAAVRSIIAGTDVIMVCHGYDRQAKAVEAVKSSVESGIIDEERIDASVVRILKLKDKYGLNNQTIDGVGLDSLNEQIDGLLSK